MVFFYSPSGCLLASVRETVAYVQRDGTCKCGLPCPLRLDQVFSYDAAVSRPICITLASLSTHFYLHKRTIKNVDAQSIITLSADRNTVTKLNHKRMPLDVKDLEEVELNSTFLLLMEHLEVVK